MGYGLIDAGNATKRNAMSSFESLARQESEDKQRQEMIQNQKEQNRATMAGTGAALGGYLAAGTAMGGPAGAAIGLALGLVGSSLF